MKCILTVLLLLKIIVAKSIHVEALPSLLYPCAGSDIISVLPVKTVGNGDQYSVNIKTYLRPKTNVTIKFDSKAALKLYIGYLECKVQWPLHLCTDSFYEHTQELQNLCRKEINSSGVVAKQPRKENFIFDFHTISAVTHVSITMQSKVSGTVPYLKSVLINFREYCGYPLLRNFEDYILANNATKEVRVKREGKKKKKKKEHTDGSCGRRQHLDYTELIVNGATSKPGDWPWHAAIYRRNKDNDSYICGGTLIKKSFVVTAAHCVSLNKVPVNPDILRVVFGKYNMIEDDIYCQERDVSAVICHGEFGRPEYLDNDIALLELSTEVVYNAYVQPACIWYKKAKHKLATDEIFGTVAGWGFDTMRSLSPQLRQITMPKIKKSDCIMKNPLFYGIMLKNEKKFCAGWGNGTSPCNGDSGGGFMIFVPDDAKDKTVTTGAWYIRGVVSVAVSFKDQSVCDPSEYVVFTNILKYKDWIKDNTNSR